MFVKPCARRQRGTQEMPVPLSGVYTMEALRETPPGQLFLETDDSDTGIEEVYAHAAAVRGTTVEALKRATTENYERIFAPQNG